VRPEVGIARVFETEHGLLIERLIPGGPAERAGLQGPRNITRRRGPFVVDSVDRSAADLIVAVDGKKVTNADDFLSIVEAKEPGDQVSLTIVRKGKELQVPVVLGGE
jgi:S1-C subfamily serine protease